jgi:hypothetical protein
MIEGTLAPQGDSFDPAKATWAPIFARTRLSANNAHKFDKLATVPPPVTLLPQSHHTAPVSLLWDNTDCDLRQQIPSPVLHSGGYIYTAHVISCHMVPMIS